MRRARFLVLPLALLAVSVVTMQLAIAPLGDAIAGALSTLVTPASRPPPPAPVAVTAILRGEDVAVIDAPPPVLRRTGSRAPAPRRETLENASPRVTETIVVPASVVTRALEKRDVGATNATAPDGSPRGARLAGVGKYRTGLRDGDVVVSVAGTPTPTVEAMVAVGLRAAGGGATRLSGRIERGEATYAVVIELPR